MGRFLFFQFLLLIVVYTAIVVCVSDKKGNATLRPTSGTVQSYGGKGHLGLRLTDHILISCYFALLP